MHSAASSVYVPSYASKRKKDITNSPKRQIPSLNKESKPPDKKYPTTARMNPLSESFTIMKGMSTLKTVKLSQPSDLEQISSEDEARAILTSIKLTGRTNKVSYFVELEQLVLHLASQNKDTRESFLAPSTAKDDEESKETPNIQTGPEKLASESLNKGEFNSEFENRDIFAEVKNDQAKNNNVQSHQQVSAPVTISADLTNNKKIASNEKPYNFKTRESLQGLNFDEVKAKIIDFVDQMAMRVKFDKTWDQTAVVAMKWRINEATLELNAKQKLTEILLALLDQLAKDNKVVNGQVVGNNGKESLIGGGVKDFSSIVNDAEGNLKQNRDRKRKATLERKRNLNVPEYNQPTLNITNLKNVINVDEVVPGDAPMTEEEKEKLADLQKAMDDSAVSQYILAKINTMNHSNEQFKIQEEIAQIHRSYQPDLTGALKAKVNMIQLLEIDRQNELNKRLFEALKSKMMNASTVEEIDSLILQAKKVNATEESRQLIKDAEEFRRMLKRKKAEELAEEQKVFKMNGEQRPDIGRAYQAPDLSKPCECCKKQGHEAYLCPESYVSCTYCSAKGHVADQCRVRRFQNTCIYCKTIGHYENECDVKFQDRTTGFSTQQPTQMNQQADEFKPEESKDNLHYEEFNQEEATVDQEMGQQPPADYSAFANNVEEQMRQHQATADQTRANVMSSSDPDQQEEMVVDEDDIKDLFPGSKYKNQITMEDINVEQEIKDAAEQAGVQINEMQAIIRTCVLKTFGIEDDVQAKIQITAEDTRAMVKQCFEMKEKHLYAKNFCRKSDVEAIIEKKRDIKKEHIRRKYKGKEGVEEWWRAEHITVQDKKLIQAEYLDADRVLKRMEAKEYAKFDSDIEKAKRFNRLAFDQLVNTNVTELFLNWENWKDSKPAAGTEFVSRAILHINELINAKILLVSEDDHLWQEFKLQTEHNSLAAAREGILKGLTMIEAKAILAATKVTCKWCKAVSQFNQYAEHLVVCNKRQKEKLTKEGKAFAKAAQDDKHQTIWQKVQLGQRKEEELNFKQRQEMELQKQREAQANHRKSTNQQQGDTRIISIACQNVRSMESHEKLTAWIDYFDNLKMTEPSIDFVLLQETGLVQKNRLGGFSSGATLASDTINEAGQIMDRGGVAIQMYGNELNGKLIRRHDRDFIWVRRKYNNADVNVMSVYIYPSASDRTINEIGDELAWAIENIQKLKRQQHIIIGGDFNKCGIDKITKLLAYYALKPLISENTYIPPQKKWREDGKVKESQLDQIFVSALIQVQKTLLMENIYSDHKTLLVQLKMEVGLEPPPKTKIQVKRPAKLFRKDLMSDLVYARLKGWVPSAGTPKDLHQVPEYDEMWDDAKLGQDVPSYFLQKQTRGSQLKADVLKRIQQSNQHIEKLFADKKYGEVDKELQRVCKIDGNGQPVMRIKLENGMIVTNANEVCSIIGEHVKKVFAPFDPKRQIINKNKLIANFIQPVDINFALTNTDPFKATGPDDFTIGVLSKELWQNYCVDVANMMNSLAIPKYLKQGRIQMLSKTASATCEVGEMRPITIQSQTAKVMGKVCLAKLKELGMNRLHPYQTGFCEGESTATNVSIFLNKIRNNKGRMNSEAVYVLVDTRAAYDRILRDKMFEIAEQKALESTNPAKAAHLIEFMKEMYNDHELVVKMNGEEVIVKTSIGVLQGDINSPMFYNMVNDKMLNSSPYCSQLIGENRLLAYADDTILLCDGAEEAEQAIKCLEAAMKKFGMEMNKNKCEILAHNPEKIGTKIAGIEVKAVVKFLGHQISTDLPLTSKMAANRCAKYLGRIANKIKFTNDKLNKLVKTRYFESLLTYFMVPHVMAGMQDEQGINRIVASAIKKIEGLPKYYSSHIIGIWATQTSFTPIAKQIVNYGKALAQRISRERGIEMVKQIPKEAEESMEQEIRESKNMKVARMLFNKAVRLDNIDNLKTVCHLNNKLPLPLMKDVIYCSECKLVVSSKTWSKSCAKYCTHLYIGIQHFDEYNFAFRNPTLEQNAATIEKACEHLDKVRKKTQDLLDSGIWLKANDNLSKYSEIRTNELAAKAIAKQVEKQRRLGIIKQSQFVQYSVLKHKERTGENISAADWVTANWKRATYYELASEAAKFKGTTINKWEKVKDQGDRVWDKLELLAMEYLDFSATRYRQFVNDLRSYHKAQNSATKDTYLRKLEDLDDILRIDCFTKIAPAPKKNERLCHNCKKPGHIKKYCKEPKEQATQNNEQQDVEMADQTEQQIPTQEQFEEVKTKHRQKQKRKQNEDYTEVIVLDKHGVAHKGIEISDGESEIYISDSEEELEDDIELSEGDIDEDERLQRFATGKKTPAKDFKTSTQKKDNLDSGKQRVASRSQSKATGRRSATGADLTGPNKRH